jgi:hypothetical protein
MMGKAHGGGHSKTWVTLSYGLLLNPLFWELLHLGVLHYTSKKLSYEKPLHFSHIVQVNLIWFKPSKNVKDIGLHGLS